MASDEEIARLRHELQLTQQAQAATLAMAQALHQMVLSLAVTHPRPDQVMAALNNMAAQPQDRLKAASFGAGHLQSEFRRALRSSEPGAE